MRELEGSLGEWLGLYNELREAERLLGDAEAARPAGLQVEVDRLQAEVEQALAVVRKALAAAAERRQAAARNGPRQPGA